MVLIARINVVVSLYNYIQVVKTAFLLELDKELPPINLSAPATFFTAPMVVVISVDGIFPRSLVQLSTAAIKALL